jgi:hypothetical protein
VSDAALESARRDCHWKDSVALLLCPRFEVQSAHRTYHVAQTDIVANGLYVAGAGVCGESSG